MEFLALKAVSIGLSSSESTFIRLIQERGHASLKEMSWLARHRRVVIGLCLGLGYEPQVSINSLYVHANFLNTQVGSANA